MSDDSRRLSPGERWRPSADALNAYQEAADYVRQLKTGGGPMPDPGWDREVVLATVKNTSPRPCDRFDILGIDTPIFLPGDDPTVFISRTGVLGVNPRIADHTTRFVVLLEPADQGDLARACLVGVVPVRIHMIHEWHEFAHIETDDPTRLVSDCVGYPILWKDSKENENPYGVRWALIKIGGQAPALGVWKNTGSAPVGPHEHFRASGVGSDANHPTVVTGERPGLQFGPDYAVNGSLIVPADQWGVYQRSDQIFVAHGGSVEPGDHLGPVPGSGAVVKGYPPTCQVLGQVDTGVALAVAYRPLQRFKLYEPLYECKTATARIMGRSGFGYSVLPDYDLHTVGDTLQTVAQSPLAVRDSQTGKLYIPAGMCLVARYAHGPGDFWEAMDFSECQCQAASSFSSGSSSQPASSSASASGSSSASQSGLSSDSGSQSASASQSGPPSDSGSSSEASFGSGSSSSSSRSSSSSESQSQSGSDGSLGSGGTSSGSGSQPSDSQSASSQASGSSTASGSGSGSDSGFTGPLDLVDAVWCEGNKIKYSTKTLNFQNGRLMSVN
ncbi:MAG: hypothetical protein JW818_00135 [Pirellulales bacterium]|nr:hypothetical protein [Pirellulales bacterium]